jgi:hypothetical protein
MGNIFYGSIFLTFLSSVPTSKEASTGSQLAFLFK